MDDLENKPAVEQEPQNSLRILLVEDQYSIVELMQGTLRKKGRVDFVDNAQDALVKLREAKEKEEEYDWLITDWHLPVKEQDGFYLVSQMKEEHLGEKTFKTMFTGGADSLRKEFPTDEDFEKFEGIQELVGKPFIPKKFMERADKIRDWQQSKE